VSDALKELRALAYQANQALVEAGLVLGTFGNVSAVDRSTGVFVIKPSGVAYEQLTPGQMVAVSLETGRVVEGNLRPSSDTPTHLVLYRAFGCGGIAHTHSEFATAFAQSRRGIPCMGTTHADYFHGDVPVTRSLTAAEVDGDYEANTARVIVETFVAQGTPPEEMPGVLVANHGPFTWGADAMAAVDHARIREYLARLEYIRLGVAPDAPRPESALIEKHYRRKHGPHSYYGQPPAGGNQ